MSQMRADHLNMLRLGFQGPNYFDILREIRWPKKDLERPYTKYTKSTMTKFSLCHRKSICLHLHVLDVHKNLPLHRKCQNESIYATDPLAQIMPQNPKEFCTIAGSTFLRHPRNGQINLFRIPHNTGIISSLAATYYGD